MFFKNKEKHYANEKRTSNEKYWCEILKNNILKPK